jgi:hypothetical protein
MEEEEEGDDKKVWEQVPHLTDCEFQRKTVPCKCKGEH